MGPPFFRFTIWVKSQRPMEQGTPDEKRLSSKPFPLPQIGCKPYFSALPGHGLRGEFLFSEAGYRSLGRPIDGGFRKKLTG